MIACFQNLRQQQLQRRRRLLRSINNNNNNTTNCIPFILSQLKQQQTQSILPSIATNIQSVLYHYSVSSCYTSTTTTTRSTPIQQHEISNSSTSSNYYWQHQLQQQRRSLSVLASNVLPFTATNTTFIPSSLTLLRQHRINAGMTPLLWISSILNNNHPTALTMTNYFKRSFAMSSGRGGRGGSFGGEGRGRGGRGGSFGREGGGRGGRGGSFGREGGGRGRGRSDGFGRGRGRGGGGGEFMDRGRGGGQARGRFDSRGRGGGRSEGGRGGGGRGGGRDGYRGGRDGGRGREQGRGSFTRSSSGRSFNGRGGGSGGRGRSWDSSSPRSSMNAGYSSNNNRSKGKFQRWSSESDEQFINKSVYSKGSNRDEDSSTTKRVKNRWTDEEKSIAAERRAGRGGGRRSGSSNTNRASSRSSFSDSTYERPSRGSSRFDEGDVSDRNNRSDTSNTISGRRSRQRVYRGKDDDYDEKEQDELYNKIQGRSSTTSPPRRQHQQYQEQEIRRPVRSQSVDDRMMQRGTRDQRQEQQQNYRQKDTTKSGKYDRFDNRTANASQTNGKVKRTEREEFDTKDTVRTKIFQDDLPKGTPVFYDNDDDDDEANSDTDDDADSDSDSDSDFRNTVTDDSDDDNVSVSSTKQKRPLRQQQQQPRIPANSSRGTNEVQQPRRLPGQHQRRQSDAYGESNKETALVTVPTKAIQEFVRAETNVDEFPKKFIMTPTTFNAPVIIACHPGLEDVLSAECTALGIEHTTIPGRGVQLVPMSASTPETTIKKKLAEKRNSKKDAYENEFTFHAMDDIFRCALYLGSATNISIQLSPDSFRCRALGELERKVQTHIPWKDIINQLTDADYGSIHFKVKSSSTKSRLLHTTAIRGKVLNGIYAALGIEPPHDDDDDDDDNSSKNNRTTIPLVVQFDRDKAHISIEAYTTPMHQRNYRFEVGKAPLREDIAYSLLYSAGWKPSWTTKSKYSKRKSKYIATEPVSVPYTSLMDPFCGSGTIPIEAAAMISGLPPGRFRSAPFDGTIWYDEQKWNDSILESLQQSARVDTSNVTIYASDRDAGIINAVKANAQRAGVLDIITDIRQCSFSAHPQFESPSSSEEKSIASSEGDIVTAADDDTKDNDEKILLISNLPFGRRISPIKTPDGASGSKRKLFLHTSLLPMYQKLATTVKSFGSAETTKRGTKKEKSKKIVVPEQDELETTNITPQDDKVQVLQLRKRSMDAVILTNDPSLLIRSGFINHSDVNKSDETNDDGKATILKTSHGGIKVQGIIRKKQ